MRAKKLARFILSMLLVNIGGVGLCLASGQRPQTDWPKDELVAIKQKVERLGAKNKVRIQLKSNEKIIGRIHEQHSDSVSIQTGKEDHPKLREVAYSDIKSIRSEERLGPGIKVLSVVMTIAIVGAFAVLTHHRSR